MQVGSLSEHPEGGRYQEVFRSFSDVTNSRGDNRSALTHIYFSLNSDEVSRFHRVASDEIWNLYEGAGLTLYVWDDQTQKMETVELSAADRSYCCVVEAGKWQAARPVADTVLVGCSVAPGFEFELVQCK